MIRIYMLDARHSLFCSEIDRCVLRLKHHYTIEKRAPWKAFVGVLKEGTRNASHRLELRRPDKAGRRVSTVQRAYLY